MKPQARDQIPMAENLPMNRKSLGGIILIRGIPWLFAEENESIPDLLLYQLGTRTPWLKRIEYHLAG